MVLPNRLVNPTSLRSAAYRQRYALAPVLRLVPITLWGTVQEHARFLLPRSTIRCSRLEGLHGLHTGVYILHLVLLAQEIRRSGSGTSHAHE